MVIMQGLDLRRSLSPCTPPYIQGTRAAPPPNYDAVDSALCPITGPRPMSSPESPFCIGDADPSEGALEATLRRVLCMCVIGTIIYPPSRYPSNDHLA